MKGAVIRNVWFVGNDAIPLGKVRFASYEEGKGLLLDLGGEPHLRFKDSMMDDYVSALMEWCRQGGRRFVRLTPPSSENDEWLVEDYVHAIDSVGNRVIRVGFQQEAPDSFVYWIMTKTPGEIFALIGNERPVPVIE